MPHKVQIRADSIAGLKNFLSGSNIDMGCRPIVTKRDGQYIMMVIAKEDDMLRMNAKKIGGIAVKILEKLPSPEHRLRMTRSGNRYLRSGVPKGLGIKE